MPENTIVYSNQKLHPKSIYFLRRIKGCTCLLLNVPTKGFLYLHFDTKCPCHGNATKFPELQKENIFIPEDGY